MSKILAALVAGLFAAGAYAQNPTGTTPEQSNATGSASQQRAQARADARPQGEVKQAGGDINKTPEGGSVGNDKAAAAGQKRVQARDARRTNKDGSKRRPARQGGTPDSPGAK